MSKYTETVNYWDKVFGEQAPAIAVTKPFPFPEIESGLEWVCRETRRIVDFGCGNGNVLLRCLSLGVEEGIGIDISTRAVSLATQTAQGSRLIGRATFVAGSISHLGIMEDGSADAVILFNIVDNMVPSDARLLIEEVRRITRPKGRILLKLNDHLSNSSLVGSDEYEKLSTGFYRETSGLYLWNLSNEDIESILAPDLEVEQSFRVEFKQHKMWNRLYFIRRCV